MEAFLPCYTWLCDNLHRLADETNTICVEFDFFGWCTLTWEITNTLDPPNCLDFSQWAHAKILSINLSTFQQYEPFVLFLKIHAKSCEVNVKFNIINTFIVPFAGFPDYTYLLKRV